MFDDDGRTIFKVVFNDERQYSIWPQDRENPKGWYDEGKSGPKQECLDHIEKVWTDMRPLSLQKHMDEVRRQREAQPRNVEPAAALAPNDEPGLVARLSEGDHPVAMPRYTSAEELRAALERGFVLVKFTDTRGGTEVGFKIDRERSVLDAARPQDRLRLVGRFTLDYSRVECSVEIDLETRTGVGRLTPVLADQAETGLPAGALSASSASTM